jgi:aerobic-type carbon monoxide dehydrogenase small subunit (CoxS/CutS family)
MPEDERFDEKLEKRPKAVTRRQFLRSAGVVGAATVLAPNLLQHGDAAPSPDEKTRPPIPNDEPKTDTQGDDNGATVHAGTVRLTLNVNGEERPVTVEPRTTLLNALRSYLDPAVTGPKLVCDRGACGACTVEMDGKTVYSCMILAADAAGKKITTIEGLANGDTLNPVQAAFVEHDALMCGFCTPGFVMSVQNYLKKNPHPTLAQIRAACAGNTCRCGTYPKVFEAALTAAGYKGKEA